MDGEVPATCLTDDTADISHMAVFGWYDRDWYISSEDSNMEQKKLGQYVCPSTDMLVMHYVHVFWWRSGSLSAGPKSSLFLLKSNKWECNWTETLFTWTPKDALGKQYVLAKDSLTTKDDETPVLDWYAPIDRDNPVEEDLIEADDIQHEAFDKYIPVRVFVAQGGKSYGTVNQEEEERQWWPFDWTVQQEPTMGHISIRGWVWQWWDRSLKC